MSSGYTYVGGVTLITEECCNCGMTFAMTADFQRRSLNDHRRSFYCPAGHAQHYTGKSDEQKLKEELARNTHLRDQLQASAEDAERTRFALIRDRHRFANGVCPCCNRYFDNVKRHMSGQHPEYDVTKIEQQAAVRYSCSCGRSFATPHGLRIHQGRARPADWATRTSSWHGGHRTEVSA